MLDPRDRGLAYGDGLFETLRVTAEGAVPLWPGHHRRLQHGARVLGLPSLPERRYLSVVEQGVAALGGKPGVVKLTLTRGPGGAWLPASLEPTANLAMEGGGAAGLVRSAARAGHCAGPV